MRYIFRIILGSIFVIVCILGFAVRENVSSTTTDMKLWPSNAVPVLLSIERLGISADIESVGLIDNAMAVPSSIEDVGWYQHGPRPGDQGSAVLAGHVNWTTGRSAVFSLLHTIVVGDTVQVTNSLGHVDTFIVRSIKDYPIDSDTSEVFTSIDGLSRLNLITCDGVWDPVLKTHLSRLVVFTEKI